MAIPPKDRARAAEINKGLDPRRIESGQAFGDRLNQWVMEQCRDFNVDPQNAKSALVGMAFIMAIKQEVVARFIVSHDGQKEIVERLYREHRLDTKPLHEDKAKALASMMGGILTYCIFYLDLPITNEQALEIGEEFAHLIHCKSCFAQVLEQFARRGGPRHA